jgi:phospholipid N-methyltransferase
MSNLQPSQNGSANAHSAGWLHRIDPGVAEKLRFFGAFLRQPSSTGSLAPSSRALGRAMLHGCRLREARTVVEFGPGTGAFTRLILERMGEETRFLALELNEQHVRLLKEKHPRLHVHRDSAERIGHYLRRHRASKADYIISGLPWANMPAATQDRILRAVLRSLDGEGMFVTFAYIHARWLPRARHFRKRLEEHFGEVRTSRIIWANVPPAFVYRCRPAGGKR